MKHVLVTGATDGIGYETARQLLDHDLHVLVHGRNEGKAGDAATRIERHAQRGKTTPVWGDLSRMQEVVRLADQVAALTPALDVLISNAGVYEKERRLTFDGFEATLAVNHFAVYLLTRRLLPLLHQAPAGRIVIVSSMTHASGDVDITDLTITRGWSAYGAYANSKLANILFTRALANSLAGSTVTVNALHPGVIATKLLRAGFGGGGRSRADGARTSVYLATASDVAAVSGEYFVDCRAKKPSATARNARLANALWDESERLLSRHIG